MRYAHSVSAKSSIGLRLENFIVKGAYALIKIEDFSLISGVGKMVIIKTKRNSRYYWNSFHRCCILPNA